MTTPDEHPDESAAEHRADKTGGVGGRTADPGACTGGATSRPARQIPLPLSVMK